MAFNRFGFPDIQRKIKAVKSIFEGRSEIDWLERTLNELGYTLKPCGYEDLLPSSVTVQSTGPNGAPVTAYNGVLTAYQFSGTLTKHLQLGFQLRHSWQEGGKLYPHLHLAVPNSAAGGNVRFYLEYNWVNAWGAEPAITAIHGDLTVAAGAGSKGNEILTFSEIDGASMKVSSMLMARLTRFPSDAADTLAEDVWLKSVDMHYEVDGFGSRSEYVK